MVNVARFLSVSEKYSRLVLKPLTGWLPRRYVRPFVHPRAARRAEVADFPFEIDNLELTNKCPFRCVMCARTHSMTRAQGLMSEVTFRKVIDEYVEMNPKAAGFRTLWFHGFGESLLHPRTIDFFYYARSNGVRAGLSLNPLMLTEDLARNLLDAAPAVVMCALDGHDDESFEAIRGVANAYEKSKSRMQRFAKLKHEGGYRTEIVLSMVNFPKNRASIDKMRRQWRATPGIDRVLAKPFATWDGNVTAVTQLTLPSHKRAADAAATNTESRPVTCARPWTKMTVKWDGDVVPCCYDYNKKYVLGNVNRQSLREIWNGERMWELRHEFITQNVVNPLCRNCEYL